MSTGGPISKLGHRGRPGLDPVNLITPTQQFDGTAIGLQLHAFQFGRDKEEGLRSDMATLLLGGHHMAVRVMAALMRQKKLAVRRPVTQHARTHDNNRTSPAIGHRRSLLCHTAELIGLDRTVRVLDLRQPTAGLSVVVTLKQGNTRRERDER